MKGKVDLYKFVSRLQADIPDAFINPETLEVVDAYERSKFPPDVQEKYVEVNSKYVFKQQLEIVEDFFNQKENIELKKEIETISKRGIRDIDLVHNYLEAIRKWDDYQDFQEESWKESTIQWCQERNYDYYYEEPPFDPDYLEKFLNDTEQDEFYINMPCEYDRMLETYKKEKGKVSVIEIDLNGENVSNKTLCELLKGIDLKKYQILIKKKQMVTETDCDKEVKMMTGSEFKQMICENPNSLIQIANIQVFPSDCTPIEIDNFLEFTYSNCVFIILVDRNNLLEIYLRTKNLQKELLENLESQNMQYAKKTIVDTGGFEIYV